MSCGFACPIIAGFILPTDVVCEVTKDESGRLPKIPNGPFPHVSSGIWRNRLPRGGRKESRTQPQVCVSALQKHDICSTCHAGLLGVQAFIFPCSDVAVLWGIPRQPRSWDGLVTTILSLTPYPQQPLPFNRVDRATLTTRTVFRMTYTIEVVPFSEYDWTFEKPGWINLKRSSTVVGLIAAFCGISFWTSLELLVLVYVTFKRRNGFYFWSIVVTIVGIILQTAGYLLKAFENTWPPVLVTIICKIGWISNVSGFSVVLWSRLHLVVRDPRILRSILIMIILNAIVLHTPIVVFEFCLLTRYRDRFLYPMEVMERIQQTIFTLQETVISGLYIYHTSRFLNAGFPWRTRKVVATLIAVQIIAISFDAALTAFDYMNMFTLKCTIHPFVYSVKLKFEFIVLNQLMSIVKDGLAPALRYGGNFPDLNSPAVPTETSKDSGGDVVTAAAAFHAPAQNEGGRKMQVGSLDKAAGSVQFITRAPVVDLDSTSSNQDDQGPGKSTWLTASSPSGNSAIAITRDDSSGLGRSTAEALNDEQNVMDVVGKPDEEDDGEQVKAIWETGERQEDRYVVHDVERQYLGKFEA
ncbi:hypothetical protein B0H66DRAFT_594798 [Apodospora peruviana]|uniref:DUF7703 domain-containing protein n=1 Tax=Apodospora peruviana TaxID=516989 RepID=A0AAE0HW29_9PEZI|nr:hypothetical protein B0H66DRAFT_594798 [Apodospora peruviana]